MSIKQIKATSVSLRKLALTFQNDATPSDFVSAPDNSYIPPLALSPAPSLILQLLDIGCSLERSQELNSAVVSQVTELRLIYELDYEKTCRRLQQYSSLHNFNDLINHIRRVIHIKYSRNVNVWLDLALRAAASNCIRQGQDQPLASTSKHVFKRVRLQLFKTTITQYTTRNGYLT